MYISRWLLSALVLAIAASAPAAAQAPNAPLQGACRADVQRLCADVQPGGGRIAQCMRAHVSEVSPGCLQAARASRQSGNAMPQR